MARFMLRLLPAGCLLAMIVLGMAGCAPNTAGSASQSPLSSRGYALKRCDGQPVPANIAAAPAAPPSVYAGSVGGNLYAFSAQNGSVRWCDQFSITQKFSCPPGGHCPPPPVAQVGKPLLAGNVVYVCVSGYGGVIYALNASDGSLRWPRESGGQIVSIPFADYAQPLLVNGLLYSGKDALDPASGAIRWQMPMDATIGAVANGVIYAYTEDSVYALSAGSGVIRWQYKLSAPIGNRPTVAGGKVYVGDINGDSSPYTPGQPDTHALNASNGTLLWSYPTGVIASSSAVVSNGLVYIGSFESAFYALDAATGTLRWRYQTGTSVESTPVVMSGVVYFTSDGAYALNAANGAQLWHNALESSQSTCSTESTLLNGVMYLGQTDGTGVSTLYALDTSTGNMLWQHGGINQLSPPVAG
jgi:outer membrane protein assembly factor BamB